MNSFTKTEILPMIALALSTLYPLNGNAQGTRVFYDGFENGTINKWNDGGASVTTIQPRSGSYAAKGGWDGIVAWNDPRALEDINLTGWPYSQEFIVRFWIRLDTDVDLKPGPKYFRLPFSGDKGGNEIIWTDLTGDLSFSVPASINGNALSTVWGCGSLADHQWHKVEIYIKDAVNGAIRMWFDDQELTCGNSNGFGYPYYGNTRQNTAGWDNLYFPSNWSNNPGWEHDANNHIYLDDVEIFSDATTGTPTTGSMYDGTIQVSGTTDIADKTIFSPELKLFPAPAGEFLTIQTNIFSGTAALKIYDIAGKEMLNKKVGAANETINISVLANGIYFLRIQSREHFVTEKFIVQH